MQVEIDILADVIILNQAKGLPDELVYVRWFKIKRFLLDVTAHLFDDVAGAFRLFAGQLHHIPNVLHVAVCFVHSSHATLDVQVNRRQRLIQFMRQTGGHFTQITEPTRMG